MAILCSTSVGCGSTLEEALEKISNCGFEYIDLLVIDGWVHIDTKALVADWDGTVGRVGALFEKYRVRPLAVNSGVGQQLWDRSPAAVAERIRETEALIRFMKHFDIGIAAIQPRNKDESRPWEEVLADCVETLREQKALGDAAGLTFALEFHVNSPFESLEQCLRFMEAMPEMPLVYDPSHFVMQGTGIRETALFLDKAVHVHVRDAAQEKLQEAFGSGEVDFMWMMQALKNRDYGGHFSIEYLEAPGHNSMEDAVGLRDFILRNF